MKTRCIKFVLTAGLTAAIAPIFAQSTVIDPALLAKAKSGDAISQVQVGECYASGKGVTRDLKQAAEWYRKAADKGDIGGEVHLAVLYRDGGKDFPRDMVQAAEWYRKAAEQGDVPAQGTLGVLYSIGQGVPQSDAEAYFWLDLAASVKGPNQEKYAANRQMVGTHLTVDELTEVEERVAKWLAAHPR
ncbi:MAG: tetratricopeptide repeat protein [Terracidiphilus sp.]|jgi:TPR repeat protein